MNNQSQIDLEVLYAKNQTIPRIKNEFRVPLIVDYCALVGIPIEFALDLLVQMVLHKRASISTLVGILHHHFASGTNTGEPLTQDLQTCADMIVKAAQFNLCSWDQFQERLVMQIDIHADVQAEIDRYQYPPPMVIKPLPVTTNKTTGYVTIKGSIILKDNHHEDDTCLDHINRANKVALAINPDTARMIQNKWRGLDKQKPHEEPADYQKRVKAFEKYDSMSRDLMEGLLMMTDPIYLTHKYDKRGRCYAQGYYINTQGNPWNKAVVEFANQELVA